MQLNQTNAKKQDAIMAFFLVQEASYFFYEGMWPGHENREPRVTI